MCPTRFPIRIVHFACLLGSLVALAGCAPRDDPNVPGPSSNDLKSWRGKTVIVKPDSIKGTEGLDDNDRTGSFIVGDEADDRILIHTPHGKIWLARSDVVLLDEAVDYCSAVKPMTYRAFLSRAQARRLAGDLEQAVADCDAAIQLEPKAAISHHRRACLYDQLRRYQESLNDFDVAVGLDPRNSLYVSNRAAVREHLGEYPKALDDYEQAILISPANAGAFVGRGFVRYKMGKYEEAIGDFNKAIRLAPEFSLACVDRGMALQAKKDYAGASQDFDKAISLEPQEIPALDLALNNAAWLKATCPESKYRDGKKAVELAKEACEIAKWKNTNFLGTLAAAYAESGDFDKAVHWQEKALEDADYRKQYGEPTCRFLTEYKKRQAHREGSE